MKIKDLSFITEVTEENASNVNGGYVVSAEDLNQLSLDELYFYRDETIQQATIFLENCPTRSCDLFADQYNIFFSNLDNYIAQREVLG
jgi:hypothetical protein